MDECALPLTHAWCRSARSHSVSEFVCEHCSRWKNLIRWDLIRPIGWTWNFIGSYMLCHTGFSIDSLNANASAWVAYTHSRNTFIFMEWMDFRCSDIFCNYRITSCPQQHNNQKLITYILGYEFETLGNSNDSSPPPARRRNSRLSRHNANNAMAKGSKTDTQIASIFVFRSAHRMVFLLLPYDEFASANQPPVSFAFWSQRTQYMIHITFVRLFWRAQNRKTFTSIFVFVLR